MHAERIHGNCCIRSLVIEGMRQGHRIAYRGHTTVVDLALCTIEDMHPLDSLASGKKNIAVRCRSVEEDKSIARTVGST